MQIKINGETKQIDSSVSLKELLSQLNSQNFLPAYFVVAINHQCIHRQNYEATYLSEGDELEIVSPMQGG